jgi:PAS domain S-box-containing protein
VRSIFGLKALLHSGRLLHRGTPPSVASPATGMPEMRTTEKIVGISLPNPPNDEFLFQAMMETMPIAIYFKDRQCRLTRVSRKMVQDLGFSDPTGLVGKTDIDLFGEAFGQRTRLDDLRVMESGRPIIGEIEARPRDNGRTNRTLTTKLPLRDESGNVVGLQGITHEISGIRETELALQPLATHDTLTDLPYRFLMLDPSGTSRRAHGIDCCGRL